MEKWDGAYEKLEKFRRDWRKWQINLKKSLEKREEVVEWSARICTG